MKAGQTNIEVGTRIQIQNIKGEDKELNGLVGTVTHPFDFGETKKDWIGVWLDAGKANMPYGGQCNIKVNECKKIVTMELKIYYPVTLPDYMKEGVINYLEKGIKPGGFLFAMLKNDLFSAVAKADSENSKLFKHWIIFIYNQFPMDSFGSEEKVTKWMEERQKNNYSVDMRYC